jgi:hypothetical protein
MNQISLAYVFLANLTAIIILLFCINWADLGRFFMICVFGVALIIDIYYLFADPLTFVDLSEFAYFSFYKSMMTGFFARNIKLCLILLSIFKFFIIFFFFYKTIFVKIGAIAAILFFIFIAPLGIASGFPATLFLAIACYHIYRRRFKMNLITSLFTKNSYHV